MEYKFPKIIGLVARSRCGKDTVADYIIHKYPTINIVKRKLAGPIKNAAKELYGFTDLELETNLKDIKIEAYNCSPRDVMVQITKSIMELSGTEFFTNRLYESIGKNELTIITDIRYEHDIKRINENDGIVIKIERNINDIVQYNNENNIDRLESDYIICNNGTLEQLYEQVDTIVNSVISF